MFRSRSITLSAAILLLGAAASAAEPEAAVRQLLAVGWEKQFSARAQSDKLYQEFTRAHGADRRLIYSYALVLLQQGRYAEAEPFLRTATNLSPDDDAPRRALLRDLMLLKRYQAALLEAEALSERLAALPVNERPATEAFDSAALLGRVVAYLSGPAAQPAMNNELRRLAASADLWPLELKQEFEQGLDDVMQMQADIQNAIARFQEKTETQLQEQKELLKESITERKGEIEQKKTELDTQARTAIDEARDELAALAAQEAPLAARYADLERQAITVRRELAAIAFDISLLLAQADETDNPLERDFLFRRVDGLDRVASRYDADLALLTREGARLEAQLVGLRRQQAAVQARFAGDQQRLLMQQKGIERGEKILRNDRRKLERGLNAPTGGLRSLNRQLTAYTTYDAFDLAEQRQQILESLEP